MARLVKKTAKQRAALRRLEKVKATGDRAAAYDAWIEVLLAAPRVRVR